MPERVLEFSNTITDVRGRGYGARVEGEERADGRWEGRVAFVPVGTGEELRTGRETLQSDLADLRYWAAGLTQSYLEGALTRAQGQRRVEARGDWREPLPAEGAQRFEVRCLDDRVPAELMGTFALEPGIARDLPDGSRLSYLGTTYGEEGTPCLHHFELQPRDPEAARGWVEERLSESGLEARFD